MRPIAENAGAEPDRLEGHPLIAVPP